MTPQEIEKLFENAPEGATHWMPESCEWLEGFWKRVGTANYFYEKGKWEFSGGKPFGHPNLVERPSPSPAWSGEGRPPAGVVCDAKCMARGSERDWFKAKVLYSSPYTVVLDDYQAGEFVAHPATMQFRPIRTPEQIAADEREAAIEEMLDVVNTNYPNFRFTRQMAIMFFELGFRRP